MAMILHIPISNTIINRLSKANHFTKMTSISAHIQLQTFIISIPSPTPFFPSKPNFLQSIRRRKFHLRTSVSTSSSSASSSSSPVEECKDDSEYQILTAMRSNFNDIVILETQESRMLLLDSTPVVFKGLQKITFFVPDDVDNVHSVFNKGSIWTDAYWDQFATLPPIVPKGPIAIYGLGGGTCARLLLEVFPSLQLDGWELDEILIYKARDYLGLADLEKETEAGGKLNVIVGDALSSSATIPGGYAGIIVDLFSEGKVLPQLEEVDYWLGLQKRLMPNGRIMINCAGTIDESLITWESNSTLQALHKAFPAQLSWMKLPKDKGANFVALTGPFPDLTLWSDALPDVLRPELQLWRTCSPSK